jgi:hypothetical protein
MTSSLSVPTIVGVPIKQFSSSLTVVASANWINDIGGHNRRRSPIVIGVPITKVAASIINGILVVVVVVLALR